MTIYAKKLVACVGGYAFSKGHDKFSRKKNLKMGFLAPLDLSNMASTCPCITLTFGMVLSGEVIAWHGGIGNRFLRGSSSM